MQIQRGDIMVRGERLDGTFGPIDVYDLDAPSFRAWLLELLLDRGVLIRAEGDEVARVPILLRQRKLVVTRPERPQVKGGAMQSKHETQ